MRVCVCACVIESVTGTYANAPDRRWAAMPRITSNPTAVAPSRGRVGFRLGSCTALDSTGCLDMAGASAELERSAGLARVLGACFKGEKRTPKRKGGKFKSEFVHVHLLCRCMAHQRQLPTPQIRSSAGVALISDLKRGEHVKVSLAERRLVLPISAGAGAAVHHG
jgi:hypothetical protein